MRIFRTITLKGLIYIVITLVIIFSLRTAWPDDLHAWNDHEMTVLRSLWIESLPPLSEVPSNKYADTPKAAALGKKFFFDSRLSGNLKVSCATCHPENENFADNLPLAHGMGTTTRRSMPLIGVAYQTWFFWDGRKDSLWSQALGPFESPVEHGFTRTLCAKIIINHYKIEYERLFGPLPNLSAKDLPPLAKPALDEPASLKAWVRMPPEKRNAVNRIYANMGKAIEAFVRQIMPGPSRFDRYVEAILQGKGDEAAKILSTEEVSGLRLFIGKAQCINCHTGPLFSNGDFHNLNVPRPSDLPYDRGRADGIGKVLSDEFNCLSEYSDAEPGDCSELRFIDTNTEKYVGAFKTPTLRNVAERAPYMHAGQIRSLHEVLEFYLQLPPGKRSRELEHFNLTDQELHQLEAFLRTLSGPVIIGR
jgi:cytochrome c peroxidase